MLNFYHKNWQCALPFILHSTVRHKKEGKREERSKLEKWQWNRFSHLSCSSSSCFCGARAIKLWVLSLADPLLSSLSISIVLSYAFRKPFELCCTQNILHIVVTVNMYMGVAVDLNFTEGCSFSLLWFVFCCLALLKKIATCLSEIICYSIISWSTGSFLFF